MFYHCNFSFHTQSLSSLLLGIWPNSTVDNEINNWILLPMPRVNEQTVLFLLLLLKPFEISATELRMCFVEDAVQSLDWGEKPVLVCKC